MRPTELLSKKRYLSIIMCISCYFQANSLIISLQINLFEMKFYKHCRILVFHIHCPSQNHNLSLKVVFLFHSFMGFTVNVFVKSLIHFLREPLAKFADMGDISKQLELKKNLECKSFDWFINNIAPDMLHKYPKLPKVSLIG